MSALRLLVLIPVVFVAACASTPPEQLASSECKIVVATFPNRPATNVNRAEQAAAEMSVSRLGYQRGGYGIGNNLFADAARECY